MKGQPCLLLCTWPWSAKPVCYYTVNLSVVPQWLFLFGWGGSRRASKPHFHFTESQDSGCVSESSWQSKTFSFSWGGLVCCIYQFEVGLMLNGASLGSELIFYGLNFRTQMISGIIIVKQLGRSRYCVNFKGLT